MRFPATIIVALLLAGCASSQQRGASRAPVPLKPRVSLTSAQAAELALQLANDKADALFHNHPFADGRPAQYVAGKWVWTDGCGVALVDYQASVTLAADGSTNSVDIQLLDDSPYTIFPRNIRAVP
ncbi:MAG: hypothetical protein ACREE6_14655 [Limisphaerales bacterium]